MPIDPKTLERARQFFRNLDKREDHGQAKDKGRSGFPLSRCTSRLQREFQIGFNAAADIMDALERARFISEPDRYGDRWLMKPADKRRRTNVN